MPSPLASLSRQAAAVCLRLLPLTLLVLALGCGYRDEEVACKQDRDCASLKMAAYCHPQRSVCASVEAEADGGALDAPKASDALGDVGNAPDAAPDGKLDAGGTCSVDNDCNGIVPGRAFCEARRCVECRTDRDSDCPGAKPFCRANACVACTAAGANAACLGKGASKPICDTASASCVECVASSECTADPARPICAQNTCVPCTTDAQCATRNGPNPGVCLAHQGGRCATAEQTIYVQKQANCSPSGGGTASVPFCRPQEAVTAITAARRLIVLRGPASLTPLAATFTGAPVTIVGQDEAEIAPGAEVGLRLSGGELFVSGLRIAEHRDFGVWAENGSTLRMTRCLIEGNRGGIYVNGAAFAIENTVIADNNATPIAPGNPSTFGGVFLNGVFGKDQVFRHNTVVNNKSVGLYCAAATLEVNSVLLHGNGVDIINCGSKNSKIGVDPRFAPARPYRLTSESPCVNAGHATDHPPDDVDGQTRTSPSDCGADELGP